MSAPPAWVAAHLRPGERVRWWGRPSLVGLAPILASAAGGAAYLALSVWLRVEEPGLLTGAPALVVAVLGLLLETGRRFARLRFTTFVVTDERFYAITSFFETDVKSVPLGRVSHVSMRRGVSGALLGFWTARVGVHGAEGALAVPAMRDADALLRELSEGQRRAADAAWLLRGD